jgi:hypothetical protein
VASGENELISTLLLWFPLDARRLSGALKHES